MIGVLTGNPTGDPRRIGFRIERAEGAYAQREQIIGMVLDSVTYSEQHYTGIRQMWPRLYDLWRGTWSGRFHPHKNNVHIPLIFSALWADAARKAATSLSSYPPVAFMGYGPDDMSIARKQEALFAAQAKDDGMFMKQVELILSASLYGTAVMQIGWKRKQEMRLIDRLDRMPLSGKTVRHVKKGLITTFDGPESLVVDLLDFFPQPTVRAIENMRWVVRRYWLDLDDIRYLASIGMFDKYEVARLEYDNSTGPASVEYMSSIRRFQSRVGMDDDTARFMDKYSRPIEILEYWGKVPSEFAPDGVLTRVVTVANRRYLMRNRPNPYEHGQLPFLSYSPTPDMHYFYAPGKAEVVAKLQIVGNRYINQSLDAADLMIDPMWFYNKNAGLNLRNLYARPGRFIGVNGDPNSQVMPMKIDSTGLQIADRQIASVRQYVQMGTAIVDDAVQGLEGSSDSRQTAREFIGRREAAGSRLQFESRIYEERMLEPYANMAMALNKQFLEPPIEVLILGDGANLDPVTMQPIPSSRETLTAYDLYPSYSARALGATMNLSKQMQQQNLLALLQALATPLGQAIMGQINAVNFFRSVFRTFEVPNINEIFTVNPALQQFMNSPEMQAMLQGRGINGVPTSGQIVNGAIPGIPGLGPPSGAPTGGVGLPGIPGAARMGAGSAGNMLTPPDLSHTLATA